MRLDTPMPPRIARLPRDKRGYPIPWNVLRGIDGTAIFTINNDQKAWEALRKQLCPICGEQLGRWRWFVGGPRSAFDENGWYLDQAGHHECMQYALAVCPYLAMPVYARLLDVIDPSNVPYEYRVLLDENMTTVRPEVFVAVASDRIEAKPREMGTPYLRPVRPAPALGYEYWRHGVQITLTEALPYLQAALGADWTEPEVRG